MLSMDVFITMHLNYTLSKQVRPFFQMNIFTRQISSSTSLISFQPQKPRSTATTYRTSHQSVGVTRFSLKVFTAFLFTTKTVSNLNTIRHQPALSTNNGTNCQPGGGHTSSPQQ
ncbi:Protein of unknown function [Pyronema omphalodes CBS 100304]|uniref:Uncharacterized protein n=1 Tax=Pyronema omphalodes (strain CBS 100304) TaxID=1076935 RepID=U4LC55_PYROM|nr:Protein of unknown function [Pyronema omphalodes CBS 100304]